MADTARHPDLLPSTQGGRIESPPERTTEGRHRLYEPGGRGGLVEVFRYRAILSLLVKRDLRVRYRYSSVGFAWAYVKPVVYFCIYYFIIGIVLDIERRVPNFAIYIFSGLTVLGFFNETLLLGSRSIVKNRAIVKKVWLPREIFPFSAMLVAAARMIPMLTILLVGATSLGWRPTWSGAGAAMLGVVLAGVFGASLGLLFSAITVFVREVQNLLEFLGFVTHWTVPMLKPWYLVPDRVYGLAIGPVISALYLWNPLCAAVELFHYAFWSPTVAILDAGPWQPATDHIVPPFGPANLSPLLWERAWIMLGVSLLLFILAHRIFMRLQIKFAEEL